MFVTPKELGQILDIAAKAEIPLGLGHSLNPVLNKLISMANQEHNIGPSVVFSLKDDGAKEV